MRMASADASLYGSFLRPPLRWPKMMVWQLCSSNTQTSLSTNERSEGLSKFGNFLEGLPGWGLLCQNLPTTTTSFSLYCLLYFSVVPSGCPLPAVSLRSVFKRKHGQETCPPQDHPWILWEKALLRCTHSEQLLEDSLLTLISVTFTVWFLMWSCHCLLLALVPIPYWSYIMSLCWAGYDLQQLQILGLQMS